MGILGPARSCEHGVTTVECGSVWAFLSPSCSMGTMRCDNAAAILDKFQNQSPARRLNPLLAKCPKCRGFERNMA